MAFNPFKSKPPVDKPKRNSFDLSFANNMTMEFGKLYPVFCKECLPGDTFRINPTFGFKFMPMVFPVQSRMRADLKFFYVRNRNLWDNWKKFIGQTDRLGNNPVVPPYLVIKDKERLATRSLLDYFGVPTTVVKQASRTQYFNLSNGGQTANSSSPLIVQESSNPIHYYFTRLAKLRANSHSIVSYINSAVGENAVGDIFTGNQRTFFFSNNVLGGKLTENSKIFFKVSSPSTFNMSSNSSDEPNYILVFKRKIRINEENLVGSYSIDDVPLFLRYHYTFVGGSALEFTGIDANNTSGIIQAVHDPDKWVSRTSNETHVDEVFADYDVNTDDYVIAFVLGRPPLTSKDLNDLPSSFYIEDLDVLDQEEVYDVDSPFMGDSPKIPLSALPLRAYEAIYNSWFRRVDVDPFILDGQKEYDKFIPNSSDGPDTYNYDFHFANWEHDFLTDAMLSPQMGDITPLVGGRQSELVNTKLYQISTSAKEIYDTGGTGSTNNNVGAWVESTGAGQGINGGNIKKLLQLDPQTDDGSLQEALDSAVTYGISINDFRNVNALQKWLEKNVRRGYRYKDQMLSHFGVGLTYEECDMPEYIGGVSEDVVVRSISQTTGTSNSPLGAQAGQGAVIGKSKHEIDKYTDEHGFIIGILCVTPIPTYSQLLPKFFTKTNSPLEHFSPEFGHIGYQPIPMKEVAPLQVYDEILNNQAPADMLERPFGYQRAFYEYLSSTDEVHGEFRNTLKDFLCDRVFAGVPNLSASFLQVRPEQLNDIFANTGNDDKIVGQIWFDCEVVRPIPKYGVPRLE